jgi:hypothetical protein
MTKKVEWGAVRVARFEIVKATKENRTRWFAIMDRVTQMTNMIWMEWFQWHYQHASQRAVQEFELAWIEWKSRDKSEQRDKPKLDLRAVPKDFDKELYAKIASEFGDVHSRVQVLVRSSVCRLIGSLKSSRGAWPGWHSILLYRQSIPSSTNRLPVPFDVQNTVIVPPEKKGGDFHIEVRLTRVPVKGKKVAGSITDTLRLRTSGNRKLRGQATILERCVSGEYKFCGSSISERNGKLYALICWRRPANTPEAMDPSKTAFLRPSKTWPWHLRLPGFSRPRRPGGRGRFIGATRKQILTQRWSRQENYRVAGSSTKGRGRNRAMQAYHRLTMRWRDAVKRYNHFITRDVINQCVQQGIGTLIYYQPDGVARDDRYLSTTGKLPDRHDSTGWDWFQVASMLQYKAQEHGIKVIVRKTTKTHGVLPTVSGAS